jgi:hypothetical protein
LRRALSLLLAACASGGAVQAAELDMAKLGEARSAVAEAGAIERLDAAGRLTSAYADNVRGDIRKDLEGLLKDPALGAYARAAIQAIDRHDQAALVILRDRLTALERAHGRAG